MKHSYSRSGDLTSAKWNPSQTLGFVDAGEEGCGVTDLLPMRNASVLLNADVQTVDADQKRKIAVVERQKKKERLLLCFKEAES